MNLPGGTTSEANAHIAGSQHDSTVSFVKSYDGAGGHSHDVHYTGTVSATRDEIEGQWLIRQGWHRFTGRFLMIRPRGQTEQTETHIAETV